MDQFVFILESLSYLRLFHTNPLESFLSQIFPQISEEWEDFKCLFLLQGLQGKKKTHKTQIGWRAQFSDADKGVKLQIV